MPLIAITDPDAITAALDQVLVEDPVRATVIGSIRADIAVRQLPGWCALGRDHLSLAARSAPGYAVVVHGRWAAELPELGTLISALPELTAVSAAVEVMPRLLPHLPPPREHESMRLFRLDELVPPTGVPGSSRAAGPADRVLLIEFYTAFAAEAGSAMSDPTAWVDVALSSGRPWLWADAAGRIVSVANRHASAGGSARIGPVYTPASERGHGYAAAVTAAATRDVLADGAIPVLFTDLANPISNAIYPRLGYYPVQDLTRVFF